ncbi:MAG: alpha-L-glutamate ligase-like protein [Phycisphaerae bacterium]|nr:alpha-L-glutamate ligase-like protein [Phycisphaerae bacterium]
MNWSRTRFWAWPWELKRRGVLGINARNLHYIAHLNPRRLFVRVDDKTVTKQICRANGIPVPETYGLITRFGDIRQFAQVIGNRQQFVVKPACGSGGRGVLVVAKNLGDLFVTSGGETLSAVDLRYHLASTLSGLFSLGGQPDKVIIEERVKRHPVFADLTAGGTPDIRIIVFQCEPITAMLRLPTRESRDRANLHQGGVGVGIDIRTGATTTAVHHDRTIERHPDTGKPIGGLAIPYWSDAVLTAIQLSEALELGYIGVDIVLAVNGPMVLEANARPGLAIQIANGRGLLDSLEPSQYAPRKRISLHASVAGGRLGLTHWTGVRSS